mgnify:CR=1 FL=1
MADAIVRNRDDGERLWFLGGGLHTWKANSDETDNSMLVFEDYLERGKVTPMHLHADVDEALYLIEGEIIIENRSATPFTCGPDDFRLYVGPFQTQIQGMTASTDFPVRDAVLAPTPVDGHEFMLVGTVAPGSTLHGYLLTWIADRGTASYGLQYDPSDTEAQKVGGGYMNRIQP